MKQIPGITFNRQLLSDETKEMIKLNKNNDFHNSENFNEHKFSWEYILVDNIRKTKDNLYATMLVDTLNQTEEWFDIDVPTFMQYLTDYQSAYNRGYKDGINNNINQKKNK